MGSSANAEYCAFTKAVEHVGDRWSLLIVRELAMFGAQGFNTLATGIPGRISRSVLTERLARLETVGLVARDPAVRRRAPYSLTPAGEQLVPTLMSLWQWAERWVPEDPAMAQRDPIVILWWLRHRVDTAAVPERQVAIEVVMGGSGGDARRWLLVARGSDPELCDEDPQLSEERYVYVEADAAALSPIARGTRSWLDGLSDGSVQVFGEPDLVTALPRWFIRTGERSRADPEGERAVERGRGSGGAASAAGRRARAGATRPTNPGGAA